MTNQPVLFLSDHLLIQYSKMEEKHNIGAWMNKKQFRVADTPLSYRQISSLEQDNLLGSTKRSDKGWRKFSFKELVYLMTINELKRYGFKHEQLTDVWNCFFADRKNNELGRLNKHISEVAIGSTFMHVAITFVFDNESSLSIYDPSGLSLFKPNHTSYLTLSLNAIVNNLLGGLDKPNFDVIWSLEEEYRKSKALNISQKEKELIDIIRIKDYRVIKIKKSDRETYTVYAQEVKNKTDFTDKDVLQVLNDKDYQDIRVVKRDGKIVNFKREATFKI